MDQQVEVDEEGEPIGKDETATKSTEDALLKKALEILKTV